jgi:hypothetical protein
MDGELLENLGDEVRKMTKPLQTLQPEEAAVLVLLQKRLDNDRKSKRSGGAVRSATSPTAPT